MEFPAIAAPPSRHRTPTVDEVLLWREAMRDTTPLRPDSVSAPPPAPHGPALAPSGSPPRLCVPAAVSPPPPGPKPPATLPPLRPGTTTGIDRSTDDRLRRGKFAIDGRIDLHGLTQSDAHCALSHFLDAGQRAGRRCVLVITGKGAVGQGGGVLRNAVPRWLAEPDLRRRIIAVHHAQPRDGGDGALYVLLKRRRPAPA